MTTTRLSFAFMLTPSALVKFKLEPPRLTSELNVAAPSAAMRKTSPVPPTFVKIRSAAEEEEVAVPL